MASRLDLHEVLCEILGSRNVYFQPPSSVRMNYPAIRYSLANIDNVHANDGVYAQHRSYDVTVIDANPDSEIPDKISRLPLCSFSRHYTADNLNHYAFTLYF